MVRQVIWGLLAACSSAWASPLVERGPTTPPSPAYVGCYGDASARTLSSASTILGNNSPSTCRSFCLNQGFSYAGVEYSDECYCGNSLDASRKQSSETTCNMPCSGDSTQACGGGWAINVYYAGNPPATPSPSPSTSAPSTSPTTYVGCFVDQSARTLNGAATTGSNMSPGVCQSYCTQQGFAYAGVEYGAECYCGNTLNTSAKQAETSCAMPCAGASSSICGGSWAMNVYSLKTAQSSTTPSKIPSTSPSSSSSSSSNSKASSLSSSATTSTTSATAKPSQVSYVGCYVDQSNRLLNGASTSNPSLTLSTCASFCRTQGYLYAGMEYGVECYCGNSYSASTKQDDSQCNMNCGGDASQRCGAGWRLSVYAVGSVTPSSSSSSTTFTSSRSTASASTSTPAPTGNTNTHSLPGVTANGAISAASYNRLTALLPAVLNDAISISTHSWELGTLANSLTEVFYPYLAPFAYDQGRISSSSPPWAVLNVLVPTLSGYNWNAAPSQQGAPLHSNLADYLQSSSSPVALTGAALINGDGALGDPCSLGTGAWITAEYFDQPAVRSSFNNGRRGADYAWAVGNQYSHLEAGPRDSRGALSHREGYYELWSDQGYMIPPFLAYLGLVTGDQSKLNDGLSQWALESNSLLNPSTGLFNHIPDFDNNPWATGNGWMLMGFARIVASINAAGQAGNFASVISAYTGSVTWVFYNLFGNMNSDNLVPNYLLNTGDSTGDTAGSAMIAAAYYRFRVLAPQKASSWLDSRASDLFDAVVGHVDGNGWLSQVVNPDGPWTVYSGHSPEGQSALGLMWAARTAAGL